MARERYLVGVSEEDLRPDPMPTTEWTPRSWLENFWYHHKVGIIIGAVTLLTLVVVLVQTLTREQPDYSIVLVTEEPYLSEEVTYFERVLATYGEDVNGDGEVVVQMANLSIGGVRNTVQNANMQALQARLITGDTLLYIFEPQYAERLTAVGKDGHHCFLTALPLTVAGMSEDALSWNWTADARHRDDPVLATLPEALCFGVRYPQPDNEESAAAYDACVALIEAYATNTPTKK